jgi:hypothetical protein
MYKNPKQSTGKIQSGPVFKGIVMLFGLFAFIWLPTLEVDAALLLNSPPDCETNDPFPCGPTDAVTVFRWTPSEDPRVDSYRVIFSENTDFIGDNILELPIIAPQVALNLANNLANGNFFFSFTNYYWRVDALDEFGQVVESGQETFAFFYEQDASGFTVIAGLVKSDLNQAGLVGAQVAVSSDRHIDTKNPNNRIAQTVFNGEYIVIALTTDSNGDPIDFPIEITSTKEGFQTTVVDDLKESEKINGVITRDVLMKDDLPLSSSLQLDTPPDGSQPEPVTVFRWTRSNNPTVHSYRLIIADDPDLTNEKNIQLNLPKPGDSVIKAPQVAVRLGVDLSNFEGVPLFWRVIGIDQAGNPVEQSHQVFSFSFSTDERGFAVITGLVKSDLNQLGLVGARVAVLGKHAQTANDSVVTEFNGEYIVIALTTDIDDNFEAVPIDFPIKITSTKEGFQTTVVEQGDERVNGVITRDLVMIADFDGDGIRDAVENASSCLDVNDADTDDDGILDGNEDADHDGTVDASETDPCETDTDNDGLLDGTEIGLTAPQGFDTNLNVFVPDADPTTTTNPLDEDSDDDGRLDGEEDANQNGQVDAGETDPSFLSAGALPAILPLLLGD